MTRLCRHCRRCPCNRPRGLCWSCYHAPGVREKYPPTSKYARQGIGNTNVTPPLPEVPTTHPPRTADKLAVLIARVERGEGLWHPQDAKNEE